MSEITKRSTKVKIFNSNVKAVLLYWKVTQNIGCNFLKNKFLERTVNIHWPEKRTNREL